MGPNRELKRALESYWKGASSWAALEEKYQAIEALAWKEQSNRGIDLVGLDGTFYDQVLDWTFLLGLAPERFQVRRVTMDPSSMTAAGEVYSC